MIMTHALGTRHEFPKLPLMEYSLGCCTGTQQPVVTTATLSVLAPRAISVLCQTKEFVLRRTSTGGTTLRSMR
jgi:hypothetical protein